MKSKLFFLVLTLFFMVSCQSTQQITGSYVNKEAIPEEAFEKVFIMVMAHNDGARAAVENQLADAAANRGIEIVKSSDVFPIGFLTDKPSKDILSAEIRKNGCDAAFTVTLLHEQTQERYVPGSRGAPYINYPSTEVITAITITAIAMCMIQVIILQIKSILLKETFTILILINWFGHCKVKAMTRVRSLLLGKLMPKWSFIS